jgi:CheY-like chemotaxis protein
MTGISARQRVLVVEDDPAMAATLQALFAGQGYEVVHSTSLRAAASMLHRLTVDLIVTDCFSRTVERALDCMNRLSDAPNNVPIVLFTAQAVDEDTALNAGFCAVLEKPFDLLGLADTTRDLLTGTARST